MKLGRPRKYKSEKELKKAIEKYFTSISYVTKLTDEEGKEICDERGDAITVRCYARPPSLSGLCLSLGIDRSTWQNYCDGEMHPDFTEVTAAARLIIENYLEEQLTCRKGNVQGVMFNLQNNYGWKTKQDVDITADSKLDVKIEVDDGA